MICATCSRRADVAGVPRAEFDPKTLSGRTPFGGTPSTMMSPSPTAGSRTEITLGAPSPATTKPVHSDSTEVLVA